LGSVIASTGKVDARKHPWFKNIDWDVAMKKGLDAGFVPVVESSIDVSNFDDVFTQETAELSGENQSSAMYDIGENKRGNARRRQSNWMNLWGLLGDDGSKKGSNGNGVSHPQNSHSNPTSNTMIKKRNGVGGGVVDDFADFDGFSFEEPSSAASSLIK
jgi:hypothetical protein